MADTILTGLFVWVLCGFIAALIIGRLIHKIDEQYPYDNDCDCCNERSEDEGTD